AATKTGAVYGRDDRLVKGLYPADRLLPFEAQPLRLGLRRQSRELLDVCPGDEGVRLARDQHDRADCCLITQLIQQRLELDPHRGGELVDRLARQVERDDGDAVFVLGSEGGHGWLSV